MKKPLSPLPRFEPLTYSPDIVRVLDDIRFGPLDEDEEYAEFCWFIREYPRIYRHHIEHAECRLQSIHEAYRNYHADTASRLDAEADHADLISFAWITRRGNKDSSFKIYWDFESFLQAVSAALDAAARVVGTAYRGDTPPTFNRFCRTAPASNLKDIFIKNQSRWVRKMKAYRDCFVHYTPVDTILGIHVVQNAVSWEIRGKLPVNPEVREILRFRYSRRTELLRYAVYTWKNLLSFDRAVAKELSRLDGLGEYPKKHKNLFHLGRSRRDGGSSGDGE